MTQLKQTKLENWLHISIESPKEGVNDAVLVPVFLCLCSVCGCHVTF